MGCLEPATDGSLSEKGACSSTIGIFHFPKAPLKKKIARHVRLSILPIYPSLSSLSPFYFSFLGEGGKAGKAGKAVGVGVRGF